MATLQDLRTVNAKSIYGIYHDDELIYIGATTYPLSYILSHHLFKVSDGAESRVCEYIRMEVEGRSTLTIEALEDYDSKTEAIEDHDGLLNERLGGGGRNGREWTLDELGRLEQIVGEEGLKAAMQKMDIGDTQIWSAARQLDWIGTRQRIDWDKYADLLGAMTDREVAEQVGCGTPTVARARYRRGIGPGGHRRSHLTDDEVREIWALYHDHDDWTYEEVAEAASADVAPQTVGRIVREESYTDVAKEEA